MRNMVVASAFAMVCVAGAAHGRDDDWNGAYAGLGVGYGWGSVHESVGAVGGPVTASARSQQDGAIFGGYAGYNWVFDSSWLVGVEGNMDWMDVSGRGANVSSIGEQWDGSLRGRLGYLVLPNTLLYMTGGYSFMEGDLKIKSVPVESDSTTYDGWTIGAGAEYEINSHLALRLQYLYADYGAPRVSFPANGFDIRPEPTIDTVMTGVTFRF